jgi:hypothetical protein
MEIGLHPFRTFLQVDPHYLEDLCIVIGYSAGGYQVFLKTLT